MTEFQKRKLQKLVESGLYKGHDVLQGMLFVETSSFEPGVDSDGIEKYLGDQSVGYIIPPMAIVAGATQNMRRGALNDLI